MLTKLRDLAPSIIRTVVPLVVQVVSAQLARMGVDPSPYSELIAQVVGAGVAALYYAVVRILETRGSQAWGWLLGLPKAPEYDATVKDTPEGEVATRNSDIPTGAPVETRRIHDGSGLR